MNLSTQYMFSNIGPIEQGLWSFNKKELAKFKKLSFINKVVRVVGFFLTTCANRCQSFFFKMRRFAFAEGGNENFLRSKKLSNLFTQTILKSKKSYSRAINRLRKNLQKPNNSVAKEIATNFFVNKEIFQRMLPEFIKGINLEKHSVTSLPSFVKAYRHLSIATARNAKKGVLPFDPLLQGNIPYVWKQLLLNNGKTCDLIRMPAPVSDSLSKGFDEAFQSNVSEEFKAFISSLQTRGEKHLYVNLMTKITGNEAIRSEVLSLYAKQNKETLIFFSLDKNSEFYLQIRAPIKQCAGEFANQVLTNLKDGSLNELPACLTEEVLTTTISSVLSRFKQETLLTRHERAVLIDIVHTKLIQKVLESVAPQSANVSCKNCIDRGVAQQVELVASYLLKQNQPVFTEDLSAIALAPAFFVSNRPMQEDRFVRLVSVLDTLIPNEGGF